MIAFASVMSFNQVEFIVDYLNSVPIVQSWIHRIHVSAFGITETHEQWLIS